MRTKIVFDIFIFYYFYYQRYKGRQPWGPWHAQDMVHLTPSPSCPIHHPLRDGYPIYIPYLVQAQLAFTTHTFLPSSFFPHLASSELKMIYSFLSLNNHIHMFFILHMTFHSKKTWAFIQSFINSINQVMKFFCFYIMLMSKYNTPYNKKSIFFI